MTDPKIPEVEFTPDLVRRTDPALYYAGMLHAFKYSQKDKDQEAHQGACFFFAIAAYIAVYGDMPTTDEARRSVCEFLKSLNVEPKWGAINDARGEASRN